MRRRPVFVAIAGGTASGKSEFAARMQKLSPPGTLEIVHLDSYYRSQDHMPLEERAAVNYDHPDSQEADLMAGHLAKLAAGQAVDVPIYDFSTHTRRSQSRAVSPARIVIVEGILVLHFEKIRNLCNLKLFIDAPAELRFERRLGRDVAERGRSAQSVREQWENTVEPMHQKFCAPGRAYADIVIDGSNFSDDDVRMVLARADKLDRGTP